MKINLKIFSLILLLQLTSILANTRQNLGNVEVRWDWNNIEPIKINDLKFPQDFIFGTCTSSYQTEGNCNCQWTEFEKKHKLQEAGQACDHWNKYKEDIQLIENLGLKAYRFSIEWSKIEPVQGQFNHEAIQHYHDVIDELLKKNIMPVVTLHHFTNPIWFENLGAFEKEENIVYFVNYCQQMFAQYSSKVPMWCTINEPGVYVFQGYIHGEFPPAKIDTQLAGIVSKNLLLAHIRVYKTLKLMPNGAKAKIGITHSVNQFDPYGSPKLDNFGRLSPYIKRFEEVLANQLNMAFYDAMLQFFVTGKFSFKISTILQLFLAGKLPIAFKFSLIPIHLRLSSNVEFEYKNEKGIYDAKEILDFIGIQPYSHSLVDVTNTDAKHKPSLREGDVPTDMPYCIYPEGLYRAINQASFIGVPIYITENGLADSKDDRRELFIRRYLYALKKAIDDGYDVRGYFYWSLLDNFEWNLGYLKRFGLYEVDFATQRRTLRKGAEIYKKIVTNHNDFDWANMCY